MPYKLTKASCVPSGPACKP